MEGEKNNPVLQDFLDNLSQNEIDSWVAGENLEKCQQTQPASFTVYHDVNGVNIDGIEVSYVKLDSNNEYNPHIHNESDAFLRIISGSGFLLLGKDKNQLHRTQLKPGMQIKVTRGTWHGFETSFEGLSFISIQSPPIFNKQTGEYDLYN